MTQYKIATTYNEYKDCHSLLEEDEELFYPTVMAIRDGKVIGMISTANGEKSLFAKSMVANSIFTSIGLYELYDKTLSNLGVEHYLFSVSSDNDKMINAVEKLFKVKPYTEIDGQLWYVRRL